MILYFGVLFLSLIAHLLKFYKKNQVKFLTILLSVFFCGGYMTGSDWIQYEEIYNLDFDKLIDFEVFEPGYLLMNLFFKLFNIDFWIWYLFVKICTFYVFCQFIYKLLPKYYFLSLFFFLGMFGLFLFIDNPLRNVIAACITFSSYQFIIDRSFKKYFVVCVLAMLFHKSAILMIPLYFVVKRDFNKKLIFICYLVLNIVASFGNEILRIIVGSLGSVIPTLQHSVMYYLVGESQYAEGNLFSFGTLAKFVTFILLIKYKDLIVSRFGLVFFNFTVVYYFLYRFAVGIEILGRFTIYFMPFYIVSTIYIVFLLNKLYRSVFMCFVIGLASVSYYLTIISSSKYIPYSNYFEYIFEEKLPYNKRKMYNYNNSPYRTND